LFRHLIGRLIGFDLRARMLSTELTLERERTSQFVHEISAVNPNCLRFTPKMSGANRRLAGIGHEWVRLSSPIRNEHVWWFSGRTLLCQGVGEKIGVEVFGVSDFVSAAAAAPSASVSGVVESLR